jgi:2,3-dihydroxybiphenyl 1,2-dioxygenase
VQQRLVQSLGYIGLASPNIDQWKMFAQDMLGMEVFTSPNGSFALKMDDKYHRYLIEPSPKSGLQFMGFDAGEPFQLHQLEKHLTQAGIEVHSTSSEEKKTKNVTDLIWVNDPDGVRVDFYSGLQEAASPFKPIKPIGGFVTGELGMGHIVRYTPNYKKMSDFYQRILRFSLSDFHDQPYAIEFLRTNPRHHSIGLIDDKGPPRLHHTMVEYRYWDDVGRAYDLAQSNPTRIAVTLGRHLNDHMTSFYVWTPDDFFIELGWAGRRVDDSTWTVEELSSPSLWGHIRNWQTVEKRLQTKLLIEEMGRKGIRAPVSAYDEDAFLFTPAKRKS